MEIKPLKQTVMRILYQIMSICLTPIWLILLQSRASKGKEIALRLGEKKGLAGVKRPQGKLVWLHAASVGEAQSALKIINDLLAGDKDLHILVTTGTVSSAQMMEQKLPDRSFHQFYPLDQSNWVKRFLNYWRPDAVFWMESELWPNMLWQIKDRQIPAALINARLSDRSFSRWQKIYRWSDQLLEAFRAIFAQTPEDKKRFEALGHCHVLLGGNIKYSAEPLGFDAQTLEALQTAMGARPTWVYASSHQGEETLAARVHLALKKEYPDLLTIIVPRHPERRDQIRQSLSSMPVNVGFRGEDKVPPKADHDIYIADTFGELGLFYRLCPLCVVGRSFSDDGGGGHNPIEPAQLGCAVMSGPHMQYQQALFDEMGAAEAATIVADEDALINQIKIWLGQPESLEKARQAGQSFVKQHQNLVDSIRPKLQALVNEKHLAGKEDEFKNA